MNKSIVVWKDGSHLIVDFGQSFEYENDANWLVTIPICVIDGEIKEFSWGSVTDALKGAAEITSL